MGSSLNALLHCCKYIVFTCQAVSFRGEDTTAITALAHLSKLEFRGTGVALVFFNR